MQKDNTNPANKLRERQLFSHGRLLSSFSHELNNHLAIIQESAGLLEDYLEMGKIGDPTLCDKLAKIVERLNARVESIGTMASRLNRFSHRFDTVTSQVDLEELSEEMLHFLERFARQKMITVTMEKKESQVMVNNSPSLIQFIIFYLIQGSVEILPEKSKILVSTNLENTSAILDFLFEGQVRREDLQPVIHFPPEVHLCLSLMGGKIYSPSSTPDEAPHITVEIPSLEL